MNKPRNLLCNGKLVLAVALLSCQLFSCKKANDELIQDPVNTEEEGTISVQATGTNLLYQETCDATSVFNTYVSRQTSTSYGITVSSSLHYSGSKSARFELRDTDPESHGGTRSEISFPTPTNLNRWYAYALYIPAAQYKKDDDDEVISQWHQDEGTPALCIRTKKDHIYLRVMAETWIDLGAIDKDKWHSYVMHVKHSAGSDGLIELWRDGQKLVNRSGANMYAIKGDYKTPYWKLGVYKSNWNGSKKTGSTLRVLYFDDIRMGNEKATYANMTAALVIPTVVTTPGITSFTLINSDTEKDVATITNGQTISLSKLKLDAVNIRANTTAGGSVKFELSGKQSKKYTDNKAPFALHGDNEKGNYYFGNWNPPALGTYTLKATSYSAADAGGTAGTSKTISFTIAK